MTNYADIKDYISSIYKHLAGQHDQLNHGSRAGGKSELSPIRQAALDKLYGRSGKMLSAMYDPFSTADAPDVPKPAEENDVEGFDMSEAKLTRKKRGSAKISALAGEVLAGRKMMKAGLYREIGGREVPDEALMWRGRNRMAAAKAAQQAWFDWAKGGQSATSDCCEQGNNEFPMTMVEPVQANVNGIQAIVNICSEHVAAVSKKITDQMIATGKIKKKGEGELFPVLDKDEAAAAKDAGRTQRQNIKDHARRIVAEQALGNILKRLEDAVGPGNSWLHGQEALRVSPQGNKKGVGTYYTPGWKWLQENDPDKRKQVQAFANLPQDQREAKLQELHAEQHGTQLAQTFVGEGKAPPASEEGVPMVKVTLPSGETKWTPAPTRTVRLDTPVTPKPRRRKNADVYDPAYDEAEPAVHTNALDTHQDRPMRRSIDPATGKEIFVPADKPLAPIPGVHYTWPKQEKKK